MADVITVKVEGLAPELERKLNQLTTKFAKKYVRQALRAAARIMAATKSVRLRHPAPRMVLIHKVIFFRRPK
jgi:hypothetical protein